MCCLPKSKRGMARFFFIRKFQYQTWIPNKQKEQNAFLTLYAPISQNGQTHSKQFVDKFPTNCLSVFGYFVRLALKGLNSYLANWWFNWLKANFEQVTITSLIWRFMMELHNGVGSHCSAQPSQLAEFKPRTFESHCANIPIWKIKNTIYKK